MPSPNTSGGSLRELFSPTFVGISVINFFGMIAYYAAFVVTTNYLTEEFGAGTATAGLAAGMVVIGCLIGRFFIGRIVNSVGYKRILVIGTLLYMASNGAYLMSSAGIEFYFAVRFISGVAVGVIGTVTGALVAVITPKPLLGRGISYFSMSTALALCFGPFVGIALLEPVGYSGIFMICAGLTTVGAVIALLLKIRAEATPTRPHKLALSDFVDTRLFPFCSLIALFCLAWGCVQAFLAGYGKTYDVVTATSLFFLFYAGAILISRPLTGKVYDSHGPAVIFYPAMVLLAAGLALIWQVHEAWAVLTAGVLMGFGFGNIQSLGQATAVSMVERERYAQATSTFYIFFDLGIGLAPYFFGLIADKTGIDTVFGINALVVLSGIPVYWLLRKARNSRPSAGDSVN